MADDREAADDFASALPGAVLTHVLSVTTGDSVCASIAMLELVRDSGGRLEALNLAQRGDGLDHQLRLSGVTPGEARRLSDRLAALPQVRHAAVEHRLYARRTP